MSESKIFLMISTKIGDMCITTTNKDDLFVLSNVEGKGVEVSLKVLEAALARLHDEIERPILHTTQAQDDAFYADAYKK